MEKALDLLEEMRQKGLEPYLIKYIAATSACEKDARRRRRWNCLRRFGLITYRAAIIACEKVT